MWNSAFTLQLLFRLFAVLGGTDGKSLDCNFTGMNAQQGYPGKSAVTISKHANWGLTKSIAKEYGRKGVTANIISPGTITDDVEDSGSKDKYETLKQKNPAGRLGDPLDIAKMVRYLSSDQAGFVNGQLMQVNGGVVV
jgi:3-oxoacyl-[acyl-carrier protein] reductase